MRAGRVSRWVLWGTLAFLYAPVLVLVIYSFNDSRFSAAWQGFTLRWYARLFESPETAAALENTLIVSVSSTVIATTLATLLAVGLHLHRFRGRGLIEALLYLPVIAPDIILGVSLLGFYVAAHLPLGRLSIILAHVAFQISFVALVVRGRLQDFPPALLEAARDLGADELRTLRHVLLPLLRPAILAGALIAFALSIDDFVITYFTAGAGASTLPLRIYSMVKRGVTPDVNALSTLLLLFTLALIVLALRLRPAAGATGR
ncbi:MAG: ABC transporter permease [Gemmatimonadetes bacterium]|nr:ABC transporter permease [Gemmatimonadota bacterium]